MTHSSVSITREYPYSSHLVIHPNLRCQHRNQEGYWDHIVTRPVSKKRKRSLEEFGGNHKRWLEEEWRDDNHFGGLSKKDLHKRWFGDDVLEWLESLVEVEIVKTEKRHLYEEDLSAILLRDEWDCGEFKGKIDAVATAGIKMATSFGFALITTLNSETGLDLSKSYLHFANKVCFHSHRYSQAFSCIFRRYLWVS